MLDRTVIVLTLAARVRCFAQLVPVAMVTARPVDQSQPPAHTLADLEPWLGHRSHGNERRLACHLGFFFRGQRVW